MISGISPGRGLVVQNGTGGLPHVPPNSSNPMTGMLRVNGTSLEVFTGSSWQYVSTNYASIELDSNTQSVVSWAMKKMAEEQKIAELCKKYPALEKAHNNYEMIKALVENESIVDG